MILFLFFIGSAVGSFLNVVIDRLPHGESIVKDRSYCDHCRHKLSFLDLIPIVSFFILGRRCRYCQKPISWQYPTVEFLTGILFLLIYVTMFRYMVTWNDWVTLILLLIIFSGLTVIFFSDLKYRIIPDQILIVLTVSSLLLILISKPQNLAAAVFSGIALFLIFLVLLLLTHGRGMGMGDVKFSLFMGLFLGFPKIVVAFYLAFLTGATVSLILVLSGKKTMKSKIAFGPFLVMATVISFFYGAAIWNVAKSILGV